MTAPVKINFKMYQGSTFTKILRGETSNKIYVPITGITKTAPVVITAVAHGMPVGWRTKITNVVGMKEINSTSLYRVVTGITNDTITINDINAVDYTVYTSGGILEYNEPLDLASTTARMQIRQKVSSTDFIDELTTENGMLEVDNVNKTVTITIDAVTTASYTFKTAVYSLELVNGSVVTPFINGTIVLENEITR